ncbi:MAG: sigma-70 family RNA polymerase sigma factor [Bryobacteraceae bacterium]
MQRSNSEWLAHLTGEDDLRHAALRDLREALLRGLRAALAGSAHACGAFLEDAVQDSLLRVMDRLHQFEGRSRFVTWATSVAIRVALTELRRRRWKDVSLEDVVAGSDFKPERAVDGDRNPENALRRAQLLDTMQAVIYRGLTARQRTALLAELRGMPQEEIAIRLGVTRNAIYKLTHDARKRLKRGLEEAGYQAADVFTALTK